MTTHRIRCGSLRIWIGVLLAVLPICTARAQHAESDHEEHKSVAGKADFLRDVPKNFATLVNADAEKGEVTLLLDGEEEATTWPVNGDAEIKLHGWWGRLDQLMRGDRVWVWFAIDRARKPRSVLMLADEISEQVIHDLPYKLDAVDSDAKTVTLSRNDVGKRTLKFDDNVLRVADDSIRLFLPRQPNGEPVELRCALGHEVYVQAADGKTHILTIDDGLKLLGGRQKSVLREQWQSAGLPGTVTFLHPLGGEMELVLDHEAMRWGRYLKNGDEVTINTGQPIKAHVKYTRPWRERTQLRLVTASGRDQADLRIGQRIALLVTEPPIEVQESNLPPDIGRSRTKDERIEWFLATVYCPCKIAGDRCTGMFYTQASCNVNACHMPKHLASQIAEMIDKEMNDEAILQELEKRHGPQVLTQHLLK